MHASLGHCSITIRFGSNMYIFCTIVSTQIQGPHLPLCVLTCAIFNAYHTTIVIEYKMVVQ